MKPVLLLIVLFLGLVFALQWRGWPPEPVSAPVGGLESQPEPATPPSTESPLELLAPPEEKDEYADVIERPLFMPDRRPPSEEPEDAEDEPPASEDASLDRLDLNAVIITPSKAVAWIRDPVQKDLQDVELGDDLNGWTVKEILADRLVLERQGETNTLTLRDYENMPPPARRPTPVARSPQQAPPARAPIRRPTAPAQRPNAPPTRGIPNPRTKSNAQPN